MPSAISDSICGVTTFPWRISTRWISKNSTDEQALINGKTIIIATRRLFEYTVCLLEHGIPFAEPLNRKFKEKFALKGTSENSSSHALWKRIGISNDPNFEGYGFHAEIIRNPDESGRIHIPLDNATKHCSGVSTPN